VSPICFLRLLCFLIPDQRNRSTVDLGVLYFVVAGYWLLAAGRSRSSSFVSEGALQDARRGRNESIKRKLPGGRDCVHGDCACTQNGGEIDLARDDEILGVGLCSGPKQEAGAMGLSGLSSGVLFPSVNGTLASEDSQKDRKAPRAYLEDRRRRKDA
jgi:hypothetical protein